MKTYSVIITALTKVYEDGIVSQLVKKEYTVGYLSPKGTLSKKDGVSAVIGLSIASSNYKLEEVHKDIINILENIKAKVYSVVIFDNYTAGWSQSNFDVNDFKNEDNKLNLN